MRPLARLIIGALLYAVSALACFGQPNSFLNSDQVVVKPESNIMVRELSFTEKPLDHVLCNLCKLAKIKVRFNPHNNYKINLNLKTILLQDAINDFLSNELLSFSWENDSLIVRQPIVSFGGVILPENRNVNLKSFRVVNTPIRKALCYLGKKGGFKVSFYDSVGGTVSLNLRKATIQEVLNQILKKSRLACNFCNDELFVMKPKVGIQIQYVYHCRNRRANELASIVKKAMTKDAGECKVDESMNILFLTDFPKRIRMAISLLEKVDCLSKSQ